MVELPGILEQYHNPGQGIQSRLKNVSLVFGRIRDSGLLFKPEKCTFFQDKVKYLQHIVSRHGVSLDQLKVEKVNK